MKVSLKGLAEIASHEGIVQMPYKDSVGVWTFGIGHTKSAGKPDPATMAKGVARPMDEVMALFAKDIAKYEAGVNKRIGKIKVEQHEYDGATSFHYNTGRIGSASWVAYWLAGNMAEAYRRIMLWNKPSAIIGRRRKEANLIRYGKYGNGWATVYPAFPSGRVNWGKGRRVNVLEILKEGQPVETPEDKGFKPLSHYQQRLIDLGYDPGPVDGKWGPLTRAAVAEFQKDQGGTLVIDGILGPITSQAIDQKFSDKPDQVALVSSSVGLTTAPAMLLAGFGWPQAAVLVGVVAAVYAVWHFRYEIKEQILTWMGF